MSCHLSGNDVDERQVPPAMGTGAQEGCADGWPPHGGSPDRVPGGTGRMSLAARERFDLDGPGSRNRRDSIQIAERLTEKFR
ncbi:hypothetical protein GCM10009779_36510 [Polymorphospora rubra]|uniref:Uncharacterized protein n=1 Tax=Polymorphospora rubra TaxID=338584 RepID=A0A810N986_9ACTN|nr:hypothetical protein Prubr_72130 [Polymorphospora rubra]